MKEKRVISWTRRLADLIKLQQQKVVRSVKRHGQSRESRISEQVRFYFSDANLRRDKYMQSVFQRDPEGWVTIGELRTFPILSRMRVSESEILFACKRSDFFITDEHNMRVKRNFHLHPNNEIEAQLFRKSVPPQDELGIIERRTIFIDKLPVWIKLDELQGHLLLQFPDVRLKYVSIPRHPVTGEGLGSAFVELGSEEQAWLILKKFKSIECDKFDAVNGKMGRSVRVLSMAKYKALRKAYKEAKSLAAYNRLGYAKEFKIDDDCAISDRHSTHSSDSESSSSLMCESDLDSLAQNSVNVRRSRNPSSIRSNSVVAIFDLPPTTSVNIRVWLSHSCAVQFLDYKEGETVAHARFASRRERDFLIKDFRLSNLPLMGKLPKIRALTEAECTDYFEAERERRRCLIQTRGRRDSWEPPPKRTKTDAAGALSGISTRLHVNPDVKTVIHKSPIAYTDTLAGNASQAEPGSSITFGIKTNRLVARNSFLDALKEEKEKNRVRDDKFSPVATKSTKIRFESNGFKKTRRGSRGGRRYNRS